MANISSKISSIEPDDESTARPAGLASEAKADAELPDVVLHNRRKEDNLPDFLLTQEAQIDPLISAAPPSFGWINIVIGLCAFLWVITAGIVAFSFFDLGSGLGKLTALQWAGLSLFIIGPVLMLWLTGYALKQLAHISRQAHQLSVTAQQLLTPDDTAVSRTALMAKSIRNEIDQVSNRMDKALSRMSALGETLDDQLQAIKQTTYVTENKSELIARRLTEEREALTAISSSFDDTMKALSSTLDTHGENLALSTKVAEQKIQEARISVEGATAKISSASDLVLKNTVEAASKLDSNQAEISRLGDELKVRASELDDVYTKHAADLASMISDLRDEQENLGSSLEARLQKMRDMSLSAQVSAQHLTEASNSGRKTVEALADAARLTDSAVKQRFADMEEMVRYSNARAESISETAARRVQDSLAQTRKEIIRIEYDMVALQEKLKRSDLEPNDQNIESASIAPTSEARPPRRSGISGLKPVLEDGDADIQPQKDRRKGESAPVAPTQALKNRLSGLRPAPEPAETFELADEAPESSHLVDVPTITPEDPHELLIPNFTTLIEEDEPAEDLQELVIEPPAAADLEEPNPDQQLLQFDPNVVRRTISNDENLLSQTKDKPGKSWWKSLFQGGRDAEPSAIDQLTAVPPTKAETVSNAEAVLILAGLGLAPGAVVDDGCIIEAVNMRISKGPLAMSEIITHRLADPVQHLYDAISSDPNLKTKLTEFARRFHTGLGDIEDNREAIRSRFESDAGRAFLLCDAALNR